MQVLPHRPPFLFIDRVVELAPERIRAVRTFRADEPFFAGHFPGNPVVPGVLLIEGLAQTMAYHALFHRHAPQTFLVGIEHARFSGIVLPQMEVDFEVELGEERFGLQSGAGTVRVAGKRVATASLRGYAGPEQSGLT